MATWRSIAAVAETPRAGPFGRRWLLPVWLLLGFWMVSLPHLAVVPPVNPDEPWQASTGWKLASTGVFGTDLFAGWFGMDRHYYGYMPVHPMLLALVYKLAGVGLWQTRFEAVAMGALALALTYALAQRLAGPSAGALAAALLCLTRTAGVTRFAPTGILFLDVARIARYDIVVPVFGLAALHAYLSAQRAATRPSWYMMLAGFLAALAGLSHVYGFFWLPVLIGLAVWQRAGSRNVAALAAGFAVPAAIYGLYVWSGFADWQGQVFDYGSRFGLTDPAWYWNNLLLEPKRYGPGLGPLGLSSLARPGLWAAVVAVPAALFDLAVRALRQRRRRAQALLLPLIALPLLYGLLLSAKLASYLAMIVPLASVAVAWSAVRLWRLSAGTGRNRRWLRWVMAGVLAAVVVEGAGRAWAREQAAQTTTPYAALTTQIRAFIQPGDRLLALHDYWLGLTDVEYSSWTVAIRRASPAGQKSSPSMRAVLDQLAPDVVVMDDAMRAFFAAAEPTDPRPREILDWLAGNDFSVVGVIDDATYGRLQIYRRAGAP